jgi:hypothetical protein
MKYRKVDPNETLQPGDEYVGIDGQWHKTIMAGTKPFLFEYRRQVEEDNTFFVFSNEPLDFDNMEAAE